MEWYDIEVDGRQTVKFADLHLPLLSPTPAALSPNDEEIVIDKKLGGIIRRGEWAWLARNSMLQIVSLRSGQTITTYEFCESRGYDNCCIKCVEEVFPNNPEVMVIAVILENFHGPSGGGSFVVLYSVELSCVLKTIELGLHLTCARFMDPNVCRRTLLQNFDGCLAVGSEEGVIVLLDLNMGNMISLQSEVQDGAFVHCHIVDYSIPLTDIHRNYRQCQQDGINFGLQMEVIESPCSIQCIQSIDLIMGLAIGLEDGRLALYDLTELQIFYVARPKPEIAMSPLVKINYLEPPDDPRPCLYIWTLHENGENLYAMMHNLMYEKRIMEEQEDDENEAVAADGQYYFESFLTSNVRLQLPLEATKSEALACQAISTLSSHGEDDSNCLCAISWFSVLEGKNKLLIFDLNQWYKEEMPSTLAYGQQPSYLAGYILNGECYGLNTYVQPHSITHFNSMQRFEEHFYPNSLSFDCSLLHTEGCRRYNWEGAQNRLINLLRVSNASIFLDPNNCFNEILRTRLMPQFTELNLNSTFSKQAKYEIMLSTALENNCVSLLRDCAKSWIDGSFMGDFSVSTGLSLSTLTDWIWKRATDIKSRCNDLCKGLFQFGGYPLDQREQKELCFITRQLKLLYDLLGEILQHARKQIPERVYSSLENNYNSLRMASNYQDLLLWLLNIGLLPEASPFSTQVNAHHDLVPYPYRELKELYKKKRSYFSKINENCISKKSGSCRLLYIDAFIDHSCKGNVLHEYWLENDGDGLYPPNSIEAMLRVMLVPELDYENKYAILLYFFLDLNMAIDEEAYKGVVANFIKFPSVFKLSAALIKTVQSFWNLDHDQFLPAVEEFISPFNKTQSYPQWLVELIIESLLTQNSANLALRILESQPSLISPMLKLKTLLSNDLISEAFHFVRSKNDEALLEVFFTCCLRNGQFGVIRDLALSENEGMILQNILKCSKAPGAESLHFVYLLQKSKYIEAVSYMDELSAKPKTLRSSSNHHSAMAAAHMETPNMVLSAFNTTMTPVTQGLTDVYFRIKNKIKRKDVDNKSPVPLSCQLIKQNANSLLGGVYHSSALSAHFATYYWGEMEEEQRQNGAKHLLSSNNAPFLRRPQNDTNFVDFIGKNNLSYPQAYKVIEKRNLVESEVLANDEEDLKERQKLENQLNPKKKRRLGGQEIIDDLSQFMKMNKQKSIQLSASDFKFNEKPKATTPSPEQQRIKSMEILTKPLVTAKSLQRNQETAARGSQQEIQGILKTNLSELGQGQSVQEEEKNLRFRLPSTDLNNSLRQRTQPEEEDDVEQEEVEEMEIVETKEEKPLTSAPTAVETLSHLRSKQISRSLSVESNKSSVSSSNASEENFYSPLSSHNNSKLDSSNLSRASFMGGPKPRRPLSRLSAEMEPAKEDRPLSRMSADKESPEKPNEKKENYQEELSKVLLFKEKPPQAENLLQKESQEGKLSLEESGIVNKDSTFSEAYVTAFASPSLLNVSARKSLASLSKNQSEQSENVTANSKEETPSLAYVTAFEKYKSNMGIGQTSSGFGSISARSTLTSGGFIPKVSSSKVGSSTPFKTEEAKKVMKPPSPAKLSECSTVLGSFDYTSSTGSHNIFAMPSVPFKPNPTEEQKQQMLDTTLGMSTYDFSVLDTTASVQQTKSSLMVTAKDEDIKEAEKEEEISKEENKEDKKPKKEDEDEEQMEGVEEAELAEDELPSANKAEDEEEANELKPDISNEEEEDPENQTKPVWADLLYSSDDDDCIVLSSSSSYIDDNDYGRAFDFRESDDGKSPRKGEKAEIASEKSFDTGEYDDYAEDMDRDEEDEDDGDDDGEEEDGDEEGEEEEEEQSSENTGSNAATEIVEIIDDSSADTRSTEGSNSDDVKLMEENSSSAKSRENDQNKPSISNSSETQKTECLKENVVTEKAKEEKTELGEQLKNDSTTETVKDQIKTIPTSIEAEVQPSKDQTKPLPNTSIENEIQQSGDQTKTIAEKESQLVSNNEKNEIETRITKEQNRETENVTKATKEQNRETERSSAILEVSQIKPKAEKSIEIERIPEPLKENKASEQENAIKDIEETTTTVEAMEEEQISLRIEDEDSMNAYDVLEHKNLKKLEAEEKESREKEEISKSNNKMDAEDETSSEATLLGKRTRSSSISKVLESSVVASPRRNTRGTSVPPRDLQIPIANSPRRGIRGTSVPPGDLETKTSSTRRSIRASSIAANEEEEETKLSSSSTSLRGGIRAAAVAANEEEEKTKTSSISSSRRSIRATSVTPADLESSVVVTETKSNSARRSIRASSATPADMEPSSVIESKSTSHRSIRGTSVPPLDASEAVASPRLRNTRGISVPPQSVTESEQNAPGTPTRRRSLRASSLQPKYKLDDETDIPEDAATPSKREKKQDKENPESNTRSARASSVGAAGKISTRRRSIMLDAITEDSTSATVDSPSAYTRFRTRLNSNESELETSLISSEQPATKTKRTRRVSLSGSSTNELPVTPKINRRSSISSQPEAATVTPRTLRGRSILSVTEEESEAATASSKPVDTKKAAVKRKISTEEKSEENASTTVEDQEDKKSNSPKNETSASSSSTLYSSSRRLTRTQLAMMEKSNSLTQSTNMEANISPPNNKKAATKGRARSTTNASHDSDDNESVSSKRSTASGATTKRRSTRRSVKDKEEHEDDGASVASSVGSEKNSRPRRSKDKSSPSSVLSVIPEDVPVEAKKRSRSSAKH